MTETITTAPDIGPLWLRVPELLHGAVLIAPSAYQRLTYGYAGGASDNWDEVAAAIDLVNAVLRHAMTVPLPRIADFLRSQMADRRFMQKEVGSWNYLDMHATPRIVQYAAARRFAQQDLATWGPIAGSLRGWLRALVGYLACSGCWGPGNTWARNVATAGPGARLLIGHGPVSSRTGGIPWCTFTGKRSWEFSGEWRENLFAPVLLAHLGLGIRLQKGDIWKSYNALIDAAEFLFGEPLDILTADERAKVLAATRNDTDALRWVTENLIADWLPADPLVIVRTELGVSTTLLEAGKAPTATMYHCGWAQDGTTYAAGACNGGRGGHAEQIEPGHAVLDLEARTGYCQRTEGPDRIRVDFPLPLGNLVAVLELHHGTPTRARYYRNGVEITAPSVPNPGPIAPNPGKPKASPSWIERMGL